MLRYAHTYSQVGTWGPSDYISAPTVGGRFDYLRAYDHLVASFGRENVRFGLFEDLVRNSRDFAERLFRLFDVPDVDRALEAYRWTPSDSRNPSPSNTLIIGRIITNRLLRMERIPYEARFNLRGWHRRCRRQLMAPWRLAGRAAGRRPIPRGILEFTAADRRTIAQAYSRSNQLLMEKTGLPLAEAGYPCSA